MRHLTFLVLLIAGSACVAPVPSEYADVLPDDRIQINLPTDFGGARRDGEWSEYYLFTARVTDDVNGLIGGVLVIVDAVTQLPPSWSNEEESTAVWGPFSGALDPVETLLWVNHDAESGVYAWGINQRPKSDPTDEAWEIVIAGLVDAGATETDSSGWFAVDFDKAHALDPNQTATGGFLCEYDIDSDGVTATAGFDDFADGGPTIDAYYHYEQTFRGEGLMDLAFGADVVPAGGNGTDELHIVRSRWETTGAGRADAYVTGGDLGALVATASECWDTTFAAVYHSDNYSGDPATGDEGQCAFDEPSYNEEDAPET